MDTTIHNNLLPNEEILWQGQPKLTNGLGNGTFGKIGTSVFGIFWLAFSLFWTGMAFFITRSAVTSGGGDFMAILFPFFGLPFVAIGIFLVFGAPLKQKQKNKSTYYYVTNKRIIINIDTQKSPVVNSVLMHDLKGIKKVRNRDYTGNIIFEHHFINRTVSSGRYAATYAVPSADNCFYRIQDADDVYDLILMRQEIANLKENQ